MRRWENAEWWRVLWRTGPSCVGVYSGGPPPDPALRRDVARVLDALSPDQRAVLVLRDLEGLSEAEAAEVLDCARGTIKSRLHRAREAFRERWNE